MKITTCDRCGKYVGATSSGVSVAVSPAGFLGWWKNADLCSSCSDELKEFLSPTTPAKPEGN